MAVAKVVQIQRGPLQASTKESLAAIRGEIDELRAKVHRTVVSLIIQCSTSSPFTPHSCRVSHQVEKGVYSSVAAERRLLRAPHHVHTLRTHCHTLYIPLSAHTSTGGEGVVLLSGRGAEAARHHRAAGRLGPRDGSGPAPAFLFFNKILIYFNYYSALLYYYSTITPGILL